MTDDGASTGGGIRISWKALAIPLVVIVVALASVVGVMALSGGDEASAAEEIGLEPVSSAGTNPFMPPVGTDQPDVTPPAGTGGTYSGDLVGLYGGTMNQSSCDSQQLVTFLQQNPDKASAWASVVGIQVVDIATYVSELTPVVLRSDTYVTNHGFDNGRATPIPTVIQAGTAVLVDKYGTPVTKCYCGSPLSKPPTYAAPKYYGPRWSGFTPGGTAGGWSERASCIPTPVVVPRHRVASLAAVPARSPGPGVRRSHRPPVARRAATARGRSRPGMSRPGATVSTVSFCADARVARSPEPGRHPAQQVRRDLGHHVDEPEHRPPAEHSQS